MRSLFSWFVVVFFFNLPLLSAQTNIHTSPEVLSILKGQYDPSDYIEFNGISDADVIRRILLRNVSADSLKYYLTRLSGFENRNSGSDTMSSVKGIGAARRWIYNEFASIGSRPKSRLIPAYLWFDQSICDMERHANVFAVLPGVDTSAKGIIIIEAHMDSRCESLCDTACAAPGAGDNGSGTVLVMELARSLSQLQLRHTMVFLLTTAEEQGLLGAKAFANFAEQNDIPIKAVLNNDVVGSVICGRTSSDPGCNGVNQIDSTQVRLFSAGSFNSPHKGLVRYIKLQYKQRLLGQTLVPMTLTIMGGEDRTGRSGDHIPFREKGYTSMRFTSANEHGDGNPRTGYLDRQHTSGDVIGKDINNDGVIDEYYVDFNYLARNALINGVAAALIAVGPTTPEFTMSQDNQARMVVEIDSRYQAPQYRIGVRTNSNDWDTVYRFTGTNTYTLELPIEKNYIVSVASVDNQAVESLFSDEKVIRLSVPEMKSQDAALGLIQNHPNPFDETTTISVWVDNPAYSGKKAQVVIRELVTGREVKRFEMDLKQGMNELVYDHGFKAAGTLVCTLLLEGKIVDSKMMVFQN